MGWGPPQSEEEVLMSLCLSVSDLCLSLLSAPQGEEGGCHLLIRLVPLHLGHPTGAEDRVPLALRRGSGQGTNHILYT